MDDELGRQRAEEHIGEVGRLLRADERLEQHLEVAPVGLEDRTGVARLASGRESLPAAVRPGRRSGSSRACPNASTRSSSGAPGPNGAGPRMNPSCSRRSLSSSSAWNRPARSPKWRNSVPFPTPAAEARRSMVIESGPWSATRRRAAQRIASRLRAASTRSGAGKAERREGHVGRARGATLARVAAGGEEENGPRSTYGRVLNYQPGIERNPRCPPLPPPPTPPVFRSAPGTQIRPTRPRASRSSTWSSPPSAGGSSPSTPRSP